MNGVARDAVTRYAEELEWYTIEVIAAPSDQVEVAVRHGGDSWLAQDDRRVQRFRQMLRTFRMESDTKREIDERLGDVFDDPTGLKSLGVTVKDAHIAVLRGMIDSRSLWVVSY